MKVLAASPLEAVFSEEWAVFRRAVILRCQAARRLVWYEKERCIYRAVMAGQIFVDV